MARVQMVVFEISGTEFGIEAARVNGIIRTNKVNIQIVPGTSSDIEGMISWRDKVRYVFNLRRRLKLEHRVLCDDSKIIMVHANELMVGCLVDEVTDIILFNSEEIEPAPSFMQKGTGNYITGIGKVEERLVVILDVDKLLAGIEVDELTMKNLQQYVKGK